MFFGPKLMVLYYMCFESISDLHTDLEEYILMLKNNKV